MGGGLSDDRPRDLQVLDALICSQAEAGAPAELLNMLRELREQKTGPLVFRAHHDGAALVFEVGPVSAPSFFVPRYPEPFLSLIAAIEDAPFGIAAGQLAAPGARQRERVDERIRNAINQISRESEILANVLRGRWCLGWDEWDRLTLRYVPKAGAPVIVTA